WGGRMNILNLAIANIRKSKGAAGSLVALIVIATLLLTIGLNIILKFNSFHDDKVEQLHGAHVSTVINSKDYKHPTGEFLQAAKELETESTLMLLGATLYYGDSVHTMNIAVLKANTNRT